jgi:hypothetical protein
MRQGKYIITTGTLSFNFSTARIDLTAGKAGNTVLPASRTVGEKRRLNCLL